MFAANLHAIIRPLLLPGLRSRPVYTASHRQRAEVYRSRLVAAHEPRILSWPQRTVRKQQRGLLGEREQPPFRASPTLLPELG